MARSSTPIKRYSSMPTVVNTEQPRQKKKSRADLLFVTGPKERMSDHKMLEYMVKNSGLKNIMYGDGIHNLDSEALKNEIQQRLNPNGHVLLSGHGGIHEGEHYFLVEDPRSAMRTRDILQLAEKSTSKRSKKAGVTWHTFSCHARNLHKEILPGTQEWRRGYVFIYSSSKPVITESTSDSLEAMLRYVADCKARMVEADPLSIFIHLTKTQGDCITLLGGDLYAPLVSHAPKTQHDQTDAGREKRLKGDERDLHLLQERKEIMGAESAQSPEEKRHQLRSILHARVDRNDIHAVRTILDAEPDLINSKDISGATPLFASSYGGNKELAELLLARGAKINEGDDDKDTPLNVAVLMKHADIVSMLLKHGADVASRNSDKENALIIAAETSDKEIVKLLLENGAGQTINAAEVNGITALMWAAEKGNTSIVRLLLDAGADASIKNKKGKTALHLTNKTQFPATAELLMQAHKQQNSSRTRIQMFTIDS